MRAVDLQPVHKMNLTLEWLLGRICGPSCKSNNKRYHVAWCRKTPANTLLANQCYFAQESLHKQFPVLLCTTKLAQSTSQHYFALQRLHRAVPAEIWHSWLRSGSAHCDLELAVQVRQCPLTSGVRSRGKEGRKEGSNSGEI